MRRPALPRRTSAPRASAARGVRVPALLLALLLAAGMLGTPAAAQQEGFERILNGTFDSGDTSPWWASNAPMQVVDGRLCVEVPAGTVNPWDSIIGQNDIPLELDQPYTLSFDASASQAMRIRATVQIGEEPFTAPLVRDIDLTTEVQSFTFPFTSTLEHPRGQVTFQLGGNPEAGTVCLDNISLIGGETPPGHVPDTGPPVRVNQVGYVTSGPKRATVVTDATAPLPWQLKDARGKVRAKGRTTVFGADAMSGDTVHLVDFSHFRVPGQGYVLEVDGVASHPFDIGDSLYDQLRYDALAFFYHQRSGIPIEAELVGEAYARPAGHVGVPPNLGDTEVPCFPGTCDYALDVRGGWYDAGDHGKYVVNGGISTWHLLNEYERARLVGGKAAARALRDGTLPVPERGNGVPDVLDEARWELEFLLRMQVPEGQPLAGMAHHRIHDEQWTGLPQLPHLDPMQRYLHEPSTTATLNLAATAAQCARIWRAFDRAFANRCLDAAERAWRAAVAHPDQAPPPDRPGGGGYGDGTFTDEFYWAAAELFITTGRPEYREFLQGSPHFTADNFTADGYSWQYVAPLGDLALALMPNRLPARDRKAIREQVIAAADEYVATMRSQGYAVPYLPAERKYVWGSNSQVLNNAVVIATAYDLTGDRRYRDAVLETMDYLLGRNGLNQSYVSGYGENPSRNQHHRFWAHQLDPSLPNPPAGSLAGGPNAYLQDPVAQRQLQGCPSHKCYIDDIGSWSTNEVAINWNAVLAWVSAFAAEQSRAHHRHHR